ncbi:uncharacterized protein [Ptychodera flava]|uniref:uncharacterized protein n=1 Tax=Ptychodera flava TaxID=63121 RepID=UPI003969C4B9
MKKESSLLMVGVLLFLTLLCSIAFSVWQVILEAKCLDLDLSNVNCTYTNRNYTTAVGIIEPILSAVLVVEVFLFYFVSRLSETVNGARRIWCIRNCTYWYNVLKENWCMKRFLPTVFAIVYFALVYAGNLVSFDTGPYRYISLIFGITSWFLLLTVSNQTGSLSCVCKEVKGRQSSQGSAREKIEMFAVRALSFLLFLFACLTNLLEFMVFTVYITKTITPLHVPTKHERVLNAADFLGMTVIIALRLDFASFFGDMAILSLKDVKYGRRGRFLQDPWDDYGNNKDHIDISDIDSGRRRLGSSEEGDEIRPDGSSGPSQRRDRRVNYALEDNTARNTDQDYDTPSEKSPLLGKGPQGNYSINSNVI